MEYNVKRWGAVRGVLMRRKLFFTVLLTVAVISFADMAGKVPGNDDIQKVMGSPSSYSGRIESIERKK